MATRKVPEKDKVRNVLRTREGLMNTVGELLRLRAYGQLTAACIAKAAALGKNAVYDAFHSVDELLRAYARKIDHWPGMFERHQPPQGANKEQMKELFINLMQDNFDKFSGNQDMRDLIVWQFSGDNKSMHAVSEEREKYGKLLFEQTDTHFAGSDIDFRSVIALLLEGSYGWILQAKNLGGTVCGRDINNERDWRKALKTIGQIIQCVWEKTENESKTDKRKNMNFEFIHLEELSAEIAANRESSDIDKQPDPRLVAEALRLGRVMRGHLISMTTESQIRLYLQINLLTVVAACDALYDPGKQFNPDAGVLLGLLEGIRKDLPMFMPGSLRLPQMFRLVENKRFQESRVWIAQRMQELDMSPELVEVALIPFYRFDEVANLEWDDFRYLRKYAKRLEKVLAGVCEESLLVETLIGAGYNAEAFVEYQCGKMREVVAGQNSREDSVLTLGKFKSMLKRVVNSTEMRYDPYRKPVKKMLMKWIDGELGSLGDVVG